MIKKKVLCLVEHVDREKKYIETLSKLSKTCDIKIVSIPYFLFSPNYLCYDLVIIPFVPSLPSPFFNLVGCLLKANINILSFNWEQLFSKASFSYRSKSYKFLSKSKLKMCSWSDDFTIKLNKLGYSDDRIIKCKNYNSITLSEELHNYKVNNKQVFLPMNYSWAFADDDFINYRVSTGYSIKIAILYKKYAKRCFISFLDQLNKLAKKNPKYSFILRPHPGVTIEDYINVGKDKYINLPKNVKTQLFGDPKKIMMESCLLISSWSTLAFDKYLVGGNSILFTPEPRPKWLDVEWNNQLTNLSTLDLSIKTLMKKCKKPVFFNKSFYQNLFSLDQFFSQQESIIASKVSFYLFTKITYLRIRLMIYNVKNIILLIANKFRLTKGSGFERDFFYSYHAETPKKENFK